MTCTSELMNFFILILSSTCMVYLRIFLSMVYLRIVLYTSLHKMIRIFLPIFGCFQQSSTRFFMFVPSFFSTFLRAILYTTTLTFFHFDVTFFRYFATTASNTHQLRFRHSHGQILGIFVGPI